MPARPAFPTDLPPRTSAPAGSWKDRNCPNMRSCWTISMSLYSLNTSDKAVLARRICMIAILGIRTALSVLAILGDAWNGGRIVGFALGSILVALGFLFVAWCLAHIGEAWGERKVLGVLVGRWNFDMFLFAMAILHVAMLVGTSFGFNGTWLGTVWVVIWLVIFGVAWVATWEPEGPESQV